MKALFKNGKIYRNGRLEEGHLYVVDGLLQDPSQAVESECEVVQDLEGMVVVPGFIDVHTHGAVGVDVNAATADDYEKICRFFAQQGTTAWLCSILTDTKEQTKWCIEEFRKWEDEKEHLGADIIGIHLEGPFLCGEYKGAMPEHLLQKGNLDLVREYQEAAAGKVRYITLSPEVEGNIEMIPALREMGIQVAIGHSGCDYATANRAIDAGALGSTHTGNAMRLLHQHEPAIFGSVLESDDVFCELIGDGRHLHPGTVRLIVKTKGLEKVVAVTDSIMATGLPDGHYRLGVNDVVVEEGDARLVCNGARAGSTLTMAKAFQNMLQFTRRPVEEITRFFTENPARLLGVYDRMGSLDEGKLANFVVLGDDYEVVATYVRGNHCS